MPAAVQGSGAWFLDWNARYAHLLGWPWYGRVRAPSHLGGRATPLPWIGRFDIAREQRSVVRFRGVVCSTDAPGAHRVPLLRLRRRPSAPPIAHASAESFDTFAPYWRLPLPVGAAWPPRPPGWRAYLRRVPR